jgi:hypothetical protein
VGSKRDGAKEPADDAELREVLARAEKGDAEVLPKLRVLLASRADIWRSYGDLGTNLEQELIRLAAGDNLLLAESLTNKVKEMKQELAGAHPTQLARLLAQRAAVGWLETYYLDTLATQNPGLKGARAADLARRRKAADRRHLAAVKTLALVQRLMGKK